MQMNLMSQHTNVLSHKSQDPDTKINLQ
jgi:hypothetical protein